ncbi:MAG TPA: diaminopimelate decarboxylase [Kofleriaceae bacterium]|nr:diaminopimelate decarboxylase [Kofleriaceae bacterium]
MGTSVLSSAFTERQGTLHCEGVSLEALATQVGTPAYVYSAGAIREQYERLTAALAGVSFRVHFSVKANSNLAVLALLRELGAGVDIVSGGELRRALAAGMAGPDVVFSGVGKTAAEMREALAAGVLFFNVESEGELRALEAVAAELGTVAPVALRVNPEVDVETPHAYTRTGGKGHKFGIPYDEVRQVARLALASPHLSLVGLDLHIGSQLSSMEPYEQGIAKVELLLRDIRADGAPDLAYLDIGGGLAVVYDDEPPTDIEAFGRTVRGVAERTGLRIVVEPGRFLVANAGVLLTRVLYTKRSGGKDYMIVDAGMTELIRPSHYDAYHRVAAVTPTGQRRTVDVVGPVCESGDFLALAREMDAVEPGGLVVVHSAGAYGMVMASNYNSRPRPCEVLVDGDRWAVVRERETFDTLVLGETTTPTWRRD